MWDVFVLIVDGHEHAVYHWIVFKCGEHFLCALPLILSETRYSVSETRYSVFISTQAASNVETDSDQ